MLQEHEDYRKYLKELLAEKIAANPSYSLRSFAKNLGLAPSTLVDLLALRKNLSLDRAHEIASRLNLSNSDREYFLLLVQSQTTKKPELRHHFHSELAKKNPNHSALNLSTDLFRLISDWFHFAILEHSLIHRIEFTAGNIARRLGISKVEAEVAIERLTRLELLVKDTKGHLRKSATRIIAGSAIPEEATKKFWRQTLAKANGAIENPNKNERFLGSDLIAFDSSRLPEVTAEINAFMEKIGRISDACSDPDHVYALNVQFFRVTEQSENQENEK